MSVLENAYAAAKARSVRVVFPEMEDPRVAEAAARLKAEGLCDPLPLSPPTQAHIEALVQARGLKPVIAKRMVSKPLYRAAAMVATGEADAMVAGADVPTRRVIEAASIGIGLSDGVSTPSSFFLMVFPDGREMIFADCAVNVSPDAAQLADIARASAASAESLLGAARVAMLSFSTGTSGDGDSVSRVREAAELAGFAGPVQADAALNAVVAAKKGITPVDANVLIFPTLDAGNIAYKLCQELGGAQAIGPFLQGFAKPVCDLSRGASPDDIVAAAVLTAAQV
ncbi:phosphate acetyltransferase [Rhodobacterales bacterium 56_14_T64]|nr:phosphate acetyltransferase [Rhodobacterales bacterium 56_14_T64]